MSEDATCGPADLLCIKGLRKAFGSRLLLDIASLVLARGQSYLLTGSNGSGKSTLMRIIAGLEPAQVAQFIFDQAQVPFTHYPAALRLRIVYVHQHPYLFNTSVRKNIAYGLKFRHLPRPARERLVEQALHWAGLEPVLDVPPQNLSGGEKQKVALARAMILGPQLLLLDEPTANLDGAAKKQTTDLIQRLCNSGERTVLIASHETALLEIPGVKRLALSDGHLHWLN